MRKVLLLFVFLVFFSCENGDCIDATIGPPSVYFSFLDASTDLNIYNDTLYNYTQIQVFDVNSNAVFFNFIEEDSVNQLVVFPPFSDQDVYDIRVALNDTLQFNFNYNVEQVIDDCKTNFFIENVTSQDANVFLNNYVYEVKF